jgi:hypothetical protein
LQLPPKPIPPCCTRESLTPSSRPMIQTKRIYEDAAPDEATVLPEVLEEDG